jgi:hypothetical protein
MNGLPDQAIMEKMDQSVSTWFKRAGVDREAFDKERWTIHQAHPHVTLENYRCRLLHRFGKIVAKKIIIYLDLKYWINFRKVLLEQRADSAYASLFEILTEQVNRGTVVCPLSFWVFEELLKQHDPLTRKATAQLIDQLSNGLAFMHHGEIVGQEVLHFIRTIAPLYRNVKQWPIRECIWTRTFSFFGDRIPVWPDSIPRSDQLLVQKNMEDFHFFIPLEDIIDDAATITPDSVKPGYDVADINRRKAQVRLEHDSFKSMFLAELMHTIKENEDHFYNTMAYLAALATGGPEENINSDSLSELQKRPWRNMIWWLFKKNRIANQLPSYHIPAALYAATSWDSSRQLTENDVFDFYHTQLAIPYSDVFLTESSLKSLVCSRHLKLDEIYNTEIISDPGEAVLKLRQRFAANSNPYCAPILQELFGGDTYERSQ